MSLAYMNIAQLVKSIYIFDVFIYFAERRLMCECYDLAHRGELINSAECITVASDVI